MTNFDALWDYYRPQATQTKFKALLPTIEDAALRAELITQIARTHSLQGQFDDAHQLLDGLDSQITASMSVVRVRYWLERGRTYNASGARAAACEQFALALALAQQIGAEFYAVDAAHMLGIASEADQQLAWSLRALEMAQNSAESRAYNWQGSLLNNIGWTYFAQEAYEAALHHFVRCRDFYASLERDNETLIARYSIAKTWRMQGRLADSLAEQRQILALRHERGEVGAYVEEELGETLYAMGQPSAAQPHFAIAYSELAKDAWMQANEQARLARLRRLGEEPSA